MDTRVFCVYNLARRVFLSSKVTIADGDNQPLKVLKVMVSGMALDSESGLWLNPLKSAPAVPRLFPFDLVYIDHDHRVLEMIEVLPGIDFPPHSHEVASAVVLPLNTLRSTQTRCGDQLLVCLRQEADELIAAADSGHTTQQSTETGQATQAHVEQRPPLPPAVEKPGSLATAERFSLSNRLSNQEERKNPAIEADAAGLEDARGARASDAAAKVEEYVASIPPAVLREVSQERDPDSGFTRRVEERGEFEDLFANWVESPSGTSALIARQRSPSAAEVDAAAQRALAYTALASQGVDEAAPAASLLLKSVAAEVAQPAGAAAPPVEPQRGVTEEGIPSVAESNALSSSTPEASEAPVSQADWSRPTARQPVNPALPQPQRASSYTVAQYGMWQVSVPAAGTSTGVTSTKASGELPHDSLSAQKKPTDVSTKKETPGSAGPVQPGSSTVAANSISKANPAPAAVTSSITTQQDRGTAPEHESAAKRLEPDAPFAQKKIADFESRLAEAVSRAALAWGRESSGDTSPRSIAGQAQPQHPQDDSRSDWRTEKIVEATGKPASAKFASLVQEKLDRLQTRTDEATAEAPRIVPKPVSENPISGKINQRAKSHPGSAAHKPAPADNRTGMKPAGLSARLRNWLKPAPDVESDRRRAHRRYVPGMVAHYFTGGAPRPYEVADISMTGFYVLTEDRWTPDTLVRMTLQKPCVKGGQKQSITILSRIVRRGSDGVAAEFVMAESLDPQSRDVIPSQATDRFALARFL